MRVTLDTNILISALGWQGGLEYQIVLRCFQHNLELVISPEILVEFKQVALRPKFGFSLEDIEDFITALIESSDFVLPEEKISIIKDDPKDNIFLETAVTGHAQYIISGDKHLLNLGEFQGIQILRSSDFLAVLKRSS
ncbi:MAG: PilT protein domain-containing protein [Promethearchaeota archaeon CR_4]|nr:MAG: PilT protein domain-containing protein [Candidatus Lokiarchaeota archaeon CR_4]